MSPRMKVVGYVRVSTRSQGENKKSLVSQERMIRDECERRGWELLNVEKDEQSGKRKRTRKRRPDVEGAMPTGKRKRTRIATTGRDGLDRALDACREGEAQALVAARLDRLSRSTLDFATLVEEAQEFGFELIVVDKAFDLNTPYGRAMARMLATFAELERELIVDRIKKDRAHRRAEGLPLGGAPKVIPPELRAKMKRQRRAGWSFGRIAETLNEQGIRPFRGGARWYSTTVKKAIA